MTDSVKYSAFSESTDRAVLAILSAVGLASAELVIIGLREGGRIYGRTPAGKAGEADAGESDDGVVLESLARVAGPRR